VQLIVPKKLRRAVPSSVGSFTFETTTGLWIEQVSGFPSSQQQTLVGTINALGTWNADQILDTTCIRVIAECGCPEAADPTFYVSGQGIDYAHSFTTQNDPCVNVKNNATVLLTPADTAFQPAQITTPSTVANCNSVGGCKDVKFHCPTQAILDDPLTVIQEPPWWRAFGFPTADPAFDTTWKQSRVDVDGLGSLTLQLDTCNGTCFGEGYESGQYQTTCYYGYGTYEATFSAAKGAGLVTSFFIFTNEPRHDEIDFEILGRPATDVGCSSSQTAVQTNYFVNGDGLNHEDITCLDYDAFTTSKTYRFVWSADGIEWFADKDNDGVMDSIRKLSLSNGDPGPFPTQPGKMFVNLWAVDNQSGAANTFGTFNYNTTTQPIKAWYDHIAYTP
jgi:beta-glucanase (GH16 family)